MRLSISGKWVGFVLLILLAGGCSGSAEPDPTSVAISTPIPQQASPELPTPISEEIDLATVDVPATPTAVPTPGPSPTPGPATEQVLGTTPGGLPIVAHRVGFGSYKIVIAADNHPAANSLWQQFLANPEWIPPALSVWFVPNVNPDGAPALMTQADTSFDGCDRNNGIEAPFISAESQALRDFTTDTFFTLFIHDSGNSQIEVDTCRQSELAWSWARFMQNELNYPLNSLQRTNGHFVDFLVGEGIPALSLGLASGEDGAMHGEALRRLLNAIASDIQIATDVLIATGQGDVWLTDESVGVWRFAPDTLIHPLAMTVWQNKLFILDSGRILSLDLDNPTAPAVVLQSGDIIDGVRVLEVTDIDSTENNLYALDRAGDVYRFDGTTWVLDRYDRPIRDRSAHYFFALDSNATHRYMLEASAPLTFRYGADEQRTVMPDTFYQIDLSEIGNVIYVLMRDKNSPRGGLRAYLDGTQIGAFDQSSGMRQPRQIHAMLDGLLVLDLGGHRVMSLDRETATPLFRYQFADHRRISSIWSDPNREQIIFAGKDAVYFVNEPDRQVAIPSESLLVADQPHNFEVINRFVNFVIPVGIPQFTQRDYQLAGAPRHYRLGVHEGFDFYWQHGTQIKAAAAGTVIRADWDYVEPDAPTFAYWRTLSFELGYTTEEAADFFRGRQIWIDHGDGVITRYVHLYSIDPAVTMGATVEAGQIIARVGNSGSPGSLEGETVDAHLHFEFRIGNAYLGQWIRPIEAREWIRRILR